MTRVLVAVGHGRRPSGTFDPGTTAGAKNEQSEGQLILVGGAIAATLRNAGVVVRVVERGGPNWAGAARIANEWGADLALEIHHDWSGAPRGCFGHWHSRNPAGERWADAMLARVRQLPGQRVRAGWHRARNGLGWVRSTNMTAVLWECDRIGTVTDHEAYGRALALGTLDHLGIDPDTEDDWMAGYTPKDVADALEPMIEEKVRDAVESVVIPGVSSSGGNWPLPTAIQWGTINSRRANQATGLIIQAVGDLTRAVEAQLVGDRDEMDAVLEHVKDVVREAAFTLQDDDDADRG